MWRATGGARTRSISPTAGFSTRSMRQWPNDDGQASADRARAARIRPLLGLHAALPGPDRPGSALGRLHQGFRPGLGRLLARGHRAAGGGDVPPDVRRRAAGRRHQRPLRSAGRVGAGPLSLSGQAPGGRARRSAVRPPHRGGRDRADRRLFAQRLDRTPAGAARHPGRLHTAGRDRGAHLHRPAVRGAHGPARAPGPRQRVGGGRCQPGRLPLADLPARDRAAPCSRPDHRLRPGLRPRRWRVRLGHLHRRQRADGVRDHPAPDHHQAGAVRLRGCSRHRGGDAGRVVPALDADQRPATPRAARGNPGSLTMATATLDAPVVTSEHPAIRWLLTGVALAFLGLFLVVPLAAVFAFALRKGIEVYLASIAEPDALAAVRLTLLIAAVTVPLNMAFGIAAAWAVARFEFRGKRVLVALIDLPFSVSPVVAGLIYMLIFGAQGWLGPWLNEHGVKVVFAVPGMVLATVFVTFPFVARELIPLLQAQGSEEEEAARILGASGWQTFWRVTLPNIKWGLLYGVILCNARAMGEFGAVSVVSGHIRGQTNTLPLHVEILYNEYNFAAAFAVASLLALLALVTLALKTAVEWRVARRRAGSVAESAGPQWVKP